MINMSKSTKKIIAADNGYKCISEINSIVGNGASPSEASYDYETKLQLSEKEQNRPSSPFFDSLITDGYA